jgi:hypothetical protein
VGQRFRFIRLPAPPLQQMLHADGDGQQAEQPNRPRRQRQRHQRPDQTQQDQQPDAERLPDEDVARPIAPVAKEQQ